jgi:hypothetical protein
MPNRTSRVFHTCMPLTRLHDSPPEQEDVMRTATRFIASQERSPCPL